MVNSRTKGASAEREFAGLVYDWTGVRLIRNLEQTRSGGYDLSVHPEEVGQVAGSFRTLAIECKRYASVTPGLISEWWMQACEQADNARLDPVLAYRANRRQWRVIMPLHLINNCLTQSDCLKSTAEVSVSSFCMIIGNR